MADSASAARPLPGASEYRLADHSADRRMLLLAAMALVAGTGGAVSAWVLLTLIGFVTNLVWYGRISFDLVPIGGVPGIQVLIVPVLGGLAIGLMARFGSEKIRGHGIPEAIETILYGESRLEPKVALLKPLSSAIAIGTGGPFGAEGPIIMTGGAIGSLFAQRFSLTAAERKTLLVAGAAAGMTGVFGTPVAAVLLAVEALLFEWKPRSFVPVMVASLVASAWRPWLLGAGVLFPVPWSAPVDGSTLFLAGVLGVAAGVLAAGLSSALYRIEDLFHRLPVHWMWWPALGAAVVGIGGLVDPRALGAGYGSIGEMLDGTMVLHALALLLAVKAIIWLVALASGTSGGVLAPLLIFGGALGGIAGLWLPGPDGLWAMLGMAGAMSGAMRAPLTGAIFVVELTGRFDALPASLAAAGAAYAVAVLVLKRSILTEKISRRGRHISQEFTIDPLALAQAAQIMTPAPQTLPASMSVHDAITFFEREAHHRSYPVLDDFGRPVALVSRADALRWRRADVALDATLSEQQSDVSLPVVTPSVPANAIAEIMVTQGVGRVCVVAPKDGRLIGIIARRDLLRPRAHLAREERVAAAIRRKRRKRSDKS